MPNHILPILEKLIGFKSITPKGEDAISYIADHLSKLGFKCEIKQFGAGEQKTTNLYAILGESSPNICFAGHVDVVPAGNESAWIHDPFKLTIEGDTLYGRGMVDMKGAIACYMAAVAEFLKTGKPKGALSFLITSDEEGNAEFGTEKMLEHIKNYSPKIDFCILGEPTNQQRIGDTVKIGRRGSVNFDLKINGKQGHAAYPERAKNPIPIMAAILNELSKKELDQGTEYFAPSNLEITSVDTGNPTSNVIPGTLSAKFNIRFNDNFTADELNAEIVKVIAKYSDNYDLKYSSSSAPFIQKYSPYMQEFVQIVSDICGVNPKVETNGGTSDARFIYKYSEVIEFGLNCNSAHKIDEHSKISDLQELYNVYYNCLIRL